MDEQLTKLLREAQWQLHNSKARQKVLTEIVDEILRSRKICRTPKGRFLCGVYQEIYQSARQQLLREVDLALSNYYSECTPVRKWANTLRDNAFRKVLDDAQLQWLALAAQQCEFQTEERDYALRELIEAIRLSGRLCRPHSNKIPTRFYEPIYEEAVNQTLLYVCQKIDNYSPDKGKTGKLMTWVNFRLDKLVIEIWNEFLNSDRLLTQEELNKLPMPESPASPLEQLREYLEEDTENIFKREYIVKRPDVNFQAIALARISEKTWQDISEEFGGVKVATLSNFFQRTWRKFAYKFREYL